MDQEIVENMALFLQNDVLSCLKYQNKKNASTTIEEVEYRSL